MKIDPQLIAKCLRKERVAQKQLYETLLPYLNAICRRYLYLEADQKDVLQESFIRIFTHLDQFKPERSGLQTWASRITINCCLKKIRFEASRPTETLDTNYHEPEVQPQVLMDLSNEELLRWLKTMPSDYYEVFNLAVIDGFSHAEIADMLQISEALSRKRLSRSRNWIKKHAGATLSLISALNIL